MKKWDRPLSITERALVDSVDRTLAFVDDEMRLNVLASCLLFYFAGLAQAITWQHEGCWLIFIGPHQPAGVKEHLQAIIRIWQEADVDNPRSPSGGELR